MKQNEILEGMLVNVKRTVEAFYSDYGVNRGIIIELTPGILGRVARAGTPAVRTMLCMTCRRNHSVYNCIDFDSPVTGRMERAAVYACNLKLAE